MEIGRLPNGSKSQESDLSFERGTTLKPGLIMHYPFGSKCRKLTNEQFTSNAEMEAKGKRLCRITSEQVLAEVKAQTAYTRATGRIHFAKATTDVNVWQDRSWRAMAVKSNGKKPLRKVTKLIHAAPRTHSNEMLMGGTHRPMRRSMAWLRWML